MCGEKQEMKWFWWTEEVRLDGIKKYQLDICSVKNQETEANPTQLFHIVLVVFSLTYVYSENVYSTKFMQINIIQGLDGYNAYQTEANPIISAFEADIYQLIVS